MTKSEAEDIFDKKGSEAFDKLWDYVLCDEDYDKAANFIVDVVGCDKKIAQEMVSDMLEPILEARAEREAIEALQVKCPYCHSTNTQKIPNWRKSLDKCLFEIQPKEWHCDRCDSDF